MHSASELHAFLSRLVIPAGQYIEIRLIVPDAPGAIQRFCSTTKEAIDIATRASATANVYVGACPRSRRSGGRDAVTAVIGAWADLDFHQLDPNRDVALELAYRHIEALGIRPTMLVHTGNGLQCWWLFHEPAAITDEWPVERFESINNGLAQRLGGDHVHDLGRVLRVPGTMNLPTTKKRERGCVPVLARLLNADGPRYHPEDFVTLAVPTGDRPARQSIAQSGSLDPVAPPDAEVIVGFERLLQRLGPHHPLTRTWEGRRRLRDASRSGFDWALALQCARVGVRPEIVAVLMRVYGFGKASAASACYVRRTVARAYAYESQHYARS